MKKLLVMTSLMLTGMVAFGQGSLNFGNRVTADGIAARVVDGAGVPLAGTDFNAQLYWGTANDASTFVAAGSPLPFRTGDTFSGYISSTVVTLAGTAGGQTVFTQMRAWSVAAGSSYEAAKGTGANYGESNVVPVVLAGGVVTPNNMIGLQGFALVVPEPSTIALGLLGLGALMLRRRR